MRKQKVKTFEKSNDLIKVYSNQTSQNNMRTMKYTNSNGDEIRDINDWENFVFKSSKKEKDWKDGRSAKSLAEFMMNGNGEAFIKKIVSEVLKENVSLEKATPELEIRFDKYGHGREHDLGVWGTTDSKKKVFVGIEAKVDESFNEKTIEAYISAKSKELNGVTTNAPKRVEELLKRNFKEIKPEYFDLRYQLLYSTVGTLDAKADISVMFIIVFKTALYDEVKGIGNYNDYIQFVNSINSERINSDKDIDIHKLKIGDKSMYSIYTTINKK